MRLIFIVLLLFTFAFSVAAQEPPPPTNTVNANTWKEFTSQDGQFSVLLPGTPEQYGRTLQSRTGPIETHDFMLQSDVAFFYLYYSKLPKAGSLTPQERKAMLDESSNGATSRLGKIISEANVSIAGNSGKEFLAERDGIILKARVFYVNDRLYTLAIAVPASIAFTNHKPSANPTDRTELFEAISAKFFNSFRLNK